jgi:pilus assembly protein CpaB
VKMTQRRMARPSLGGLMATRQGALMLALVCAICAAGILVFALGQYRQNLKTSVKQATVLVATAEIPKGTSGSAIAARGLYKSMPIVASQASPTAISDAGLLAGRVTTTEILPGQQLSTADFSGVTGVTGLLTPDQRAISLSISEAPGDNDVLQPGDYVDVYAAFHGSVVVLLDPDVQVIKTASGTASTSQSAGGGAGGSTLSGSSLVLAVSSHQASDLIYAAENGTLYLTLRPDNGTTSPRPLTNLSSVIHDSVAVINGK